MQRETLRATVNSHDFAIYPLTFLARQEACNSSDVERAATADERRGVSSSLFLLGGAVYSSDNLHLQLEALHWSCFRYWVCSAWQRHGTCLSRYLQALSH